jgi:hypothetical protein
VRQPHPVPVGFVAGTDSAECRLAGLAPRAGWWAHFLPDRRRPLFRWSPRCRRLEAYARDDRRAVAGKPGWPNCRSWVKSLNPAASMFSSCKFGEVATSATLIAACLKNERILGYNLNFPHVPFGTHL